MGNAHAVRSPSDDSLGCFACAAKIPVGPLRNSRVKHLTVLLTVEGVAPDGTVEADVVPWPPGRFHGRVQWHPEYD